MVCYARPASRLAILLIGTLLVVTRPLGHFLDTAAFLVAATVATGGAAIAAALVFAAFMSARRRRASGGGCVSCQFRCQHAMTGPSRRPWLVTTADRTEPAPETPGTAKILGTPARPARPAHARSASPPGRPGPVLLPVPSVRAAALAGTSGDPKAPKTGPRWPDRPLHRAPGQQERVGSPA